MLLYPQSVNVYEINNREKTKVKKFNLVSRNLLVNRISFPKKLKRGYEVDDSNNFYVYFRGKLTSADKYLKPFNLRCRYVAIQSGPKNRIAGIVIFKLNDKLPLEECIRREKETIYILFSHGNYSDMGHMFFMFARMCSFLNVNLVSYDYNGYGMSSGRPSESNLYTNITSVYNYMVNCLKVDPKKIVVYGNSLGSAPSCFLVSQPEKYPVGGLILHSPLASGLRVFFKSLVKNHRFDAFKNTEFLKNCPLIPVYLMHGMADDQIPIEQAVELTCIVKESHESHMSRLFNQNNKFHLDKIPDPEIMAEHTHLNQENIVVIPRGRFSQVIQDARKMNQTNQYVKTWWIEGAGHHDIESSNSSDYYDHLSGFLDLCRRWQSEDLSPS